MDDAWRNKERRPRFARSFRPRFQRRDAFAAMDLTQTGFLIFLAAVGVERLLELRVSRRHQQELASLGARKHEDPRYRLMVALHAGVLVGAALEVALLRRPFIPWLAASA